MEKSLIKAFGLVYLLVATLKKVQTIEDGPKNLVFN